MQFPGITRLRRLNWSCAYVARHCVTVRKLHALTHIFRICIPANQELYNNTGLEVLKHFSCSTQLSMIFIMFINVKMLAFLTFISMIKTSVSSKTSKPFIFKHFRVYEKLNFVLSWVEHGKKFYNLGPGLWTPVRSTGLASPIIKYLLHIVDINGLLSVTCDLRVSRLDTHLCP